MPPYTRGLHEVGDGLHAWLQPDGGWGWSNAGLVVGDGASLLVDTLFDLALTRDMLEAMGPVTGSAPIATVVNTHANGDHCYGNELVVGAEIVATHAAAEEMGEVPPAMLAALNEAPGEIGELFRRFFGAFDFAGITPTLPTRTFQHRLDVEVGGRVVELHEVGPAHTRGDAIAHVPDAGVVFTGDICFIGGTPIVWAGPIQRWIEACDLICSFAPEVVVPGHGPVTDVAGVLEVRGYLEVLDREARARHDAGVGPLDAARELHALLADGPFAAWGESGRVAVNVEAVYRALDAGHRSADVVELFRQMAQLEGWHPEAELGGDR